MQIKIELKSDTAPGAGDGEGGVVDRDITYTELGLPIITARRIKGCLREAALEVYEALTLAGHSELVTKKDLIKLFGSSFNEVSQPGYLQLSDARHADAEELEAWLKWATKQEKTIFNTATILDQYTGIRAQTSMSRVTGGPLSNTLRVTRVFKKGNIFIANAHLEAPQNEYTALLQILAWACAATRHIGLSRNRGLGYIECSLQDGNYNSQQALQELAKKLGA